MILLEMMSEVVIGVMVMEVDKVADEVTVKLTNMMAKIRNKDFSDIDMIFMEIMLELVSAVRRS